MNKAFLIGRLTADPELKRTGTGTAVCKFTLAVTRRYADAQGNRQADFLPVIAWRQLGESCHKYLAKGKKCAVTGEIQTRSYEAQDGTKRYATEVIADEVEFLSSRQSGEGQSDLKAAPGAAAAENGFTELDEEELPF